MIRRLAQSIQMYHLLLIVIVLFNCVSTSIFAQSERGEERTVEDSIHVKPGLSPQGGILVQTNHSETERKIYAALDQPAHFEFPGNPLADVIFFVESMHGIPILFDRIAFKEIGIESDIEVRLVISNLSLAHSLNLLLEPHGLTYLVKNGVLQITHSEAAKTHTETRIYNVRALNVGDPEALADVLIYTTGKDSWRQFHGPGDLSFFNGSLVIMQNQKTHKEIEAVLNKLLHDMQSSEESPKWQAKDRTQ